MEHNCRSLSIVVPAYNEEESLATVIDSAVQVMQAHAGIEYEILIYNDGSTDRTGPIADELAKKYPAVRAIHNDGNQGIGYSIKDSIRQAAKQWLVVIPADYQFVFEDIAPYFPLCTSHDMIIGSILNIKRRNVIRRFMSNCFWLVERLCFDLKLSYTGGMNLFKTEQLKRLALRTNSHTILSEIIIKLLRQRVTYATMGFHLRERETGVSHAAKPSSILKAFMSTVRLWIELNLSKENNHA